MSVRWACITSTPDFKVGDPRPEGYLAEHAWADVHLAAGLRQLSCAVCAHWYFPTELSGLHLKTSALTTRGEPVVVVDPICLSCAARKPDVGEILTPDELMDWEISVGTCPHCRRMYKRLALHMRKQHPEFVEEHQS